MKIVFKQPEKDNYHSAAMLEELGIKQCLLKRIHSKLDKNNITKKRHYHRFVEIHIVEKGYQIYEIEGKLARIEAGSFLIISPLSYHCVTEEASETEKHSLTFGLKCGGAAEKLLSEIGAAFSCVAPPAIRECVEFIEKEKREGRPYHTVLTSCRVLECILQMFRTLPTAVVEKSSEHSEDVRLMLAKQYVEDNIRYAVSVGELADYCHLGKKQLTRIFLCGEGCTVSEYVRQARCRHIEKLLADPWRTLSGISEEMNFCNEYYFNSYFKRCRGMSPGAYRRSIIGAR